MGFISSDEVIGLRQFRCPRPRQDPSLPRLLPATPFSWPNNKPLPIDTTMAGRRKYGPTIASFVVTSAAGTARAAARTRIAGLSTCRGDTNPTARSAMIAAVLTTNR